MMKTVYLIHLMKKIYIHGKAISSTACFRHVQTDLDTLYIPNVILESQLLKQVDPFLLQDSHLM